MHMGALRRLHHLRRIDLAQARDVLGHGAGEQLDVLRHVADVRAELLARPLRQVGLVEPHGAGASASTRR